MQFLKDARQQALIEELQSLRERWASVTAEKLRDLEQMIELAETSHAAFSRESYEPGHFTASAFVLDPTGSKLLLIRHKKLKMWLQPGGHVESTDRDFVAAARRELGEETSLTEIDLEQRLFDLDVHQIPAIGEAPPHLHHDVRALFVARSSDIQAGDDAADARWFDLEQVAESGALLAQEWGTDESVREAARRLLNRTLETGAEGR